MSMHTYLITYGEVGLWDAEMIVEAEDMVACAVKAMERVSGMGGMILSIELDDELPTH